MYQIYTRTTPAFDKSDYPRNLANLINSTKQAIETFMDEYRVPIKCSLAFLTLLRHKNFLSESLGGDALFYTVAGCSELDFETGQSSWVIYACMPDELSDIELELNRLCLPRANAVGSKIHLSNGYVGFCRKEGKTLPKAAIGSELTVVYEFIGGVGAKTNDGELLSIPWAYIPIEDLEQPIEQFEMYDKYFNLGEIAQQKGDYKVAIQHYSNAIQSYSGDPNAYSRRGDAKEEIKDFQGALDDYNKALQLAPRDYFTLNNRAWLRKKQGQINLALVDLNKVLQINPSYAMAYALRADCMMDLGNLEKALADTNKAIEFDSGLQIARGRRAHLLSLGVFSNYKPHAWGKSSAVPSVADALNRALADLEFVINRNREQAKVHIKEAKGYIEQSDYNLALLHANYGIFHSPDDPELYNLRATTLEKLSYFNDAFYDYSKAIELDTSHFIAYHNRGQLHLAINLIDNAIEDFSQALRINPNYIESLIARAKVKLRMNVSPIDDVKSILKQSPNNTIALGIIAIYFAMNDKHNKAIEASNRLLSQDEDSDIYEIRAHAYAELGEYKKSLSDYSKAIELNPQSGTAYFERGELNLKLHRYGQAIQDFSDAIHKPMPPNQYYGHSYIMRGRAYLLNGDEESGLKDLDNAIQNHYHLQLACIAKAQHFIEKGEWETAYGVYSVLVKAEPENITGYQGRIHTIMTSAKQHLFLIDTDELFADIDKAIELQPDLEEKYTKLKNEIMKIIE